jgi:pyruvate dehydrogenase phosphatase
MFTFSFPVRYKWSTEELRKIAVPFYGENVIASSYHTPPYLTAKPELTYHRLTPRDKFLIVASDGLWDIVTPQQAVRLVGEHMRGKMVLNPFKLPKHNVNLRELNKLLLQRKECFNMKPIDRNAATHLLRNALGGTDYGDEQDNLSKILTLPQNLVRDFRDDITISVVFFNSEYLRHVHT